MATRYRRGNRRTKKPVTEAIQDVIKEFSDQPVRLNVPIRLELRAEEAFQDIERVFSDSNLQELAESFVQQFMLTALEQMYWNEDGKARRNLRDYTLKPLSNIFRQVAKEEAEARAAALGASGGGSNKKKEGATAADYLRVRENAADMVEGFHDLWAHASRVFPESSGGKLGASIGDVPSMMDMDLKSYMRHGRDQSDSPYNRFFYAVEFGTGIAENVGGPQFVRAGGRFKDASEAPGRRGAWWYGAEPGQGTIWQGQKGFHFLYDIREGKREIHRKYRTTFTINIGAFVQDFFALKLRRARGGR